VNGGVPPFEQVFQLRTETLLIGFVETEGECKGVSNRLVLLVRASSFVEVLRGHKILEFAIQRLDCYRAGCNCDERSCKLLAEGVTGVGRCSNVVSGLKFVANGDVDPCPPHVLLKDGTDTSGSATAGDIFLTVLPPVSGEVVCESLAFGICGCCGPVFLVLFGAVRESLTPLDGSPPSLLFGVFGLSYWASLLPAKGFKYPGFQSGKREWHRHGVMLRSFRAR